MKTTGSRAHDEIFAQALGLAGRERLAFLAERCGADAGLRREVGALLEGAEAPDERLERHVGRARQQLLRSLVAADADSQEDLTGQRFGAWQIDEKVARGGLATVYRAHREDVESGASAAFKVLRRGLDTDDVVARFRAERQILSSLDHPSISRILDGGALPDGRPFLVLEFVDGEPITAYCEARELDLPARLRLLIDVLRALHHAHLHRVVHRDVKPSNVLVSDAGEVVLVDFGIAKLLDPDAEPGAAAMTGAGTALLTPGYGSPEQCMGRAVTPASDVYQAGLMLYELLTGQRPSGGRPADRGFSVPPPGVALRGTPRNERVRGDLDAIVGKATHFDAAMRYATADEMARDLERHLDGRPVLARSDSPAWRVPGPGLRDPRRMRWVAVAAIGIAAYVLTEAA